MSSHDITAEELMQDQAQRLLDNTVFMDKMGSRDPVLIKEAQDSVDAYTRTKMREDGFLRRIMPPIPVKNEQLTRLVNSDDPAIVVDKEGDSPAAVSLPFATLPSNIYIRGDRYLVTFARIMTPRFTKDVDQLRTWIMDIRQVLSDNAIKDMLAEEDGKFLAAINQVLIGPGATVPTSGTVQYEEISGGINRDSLWDSMKVMPGTPSNLEVHTCLVNNITIKDVCKFTRGEMGGDMSQDIMRNGWSDQNFMGKRWLITIKKDLVETNSLYMFSDPKFIGKHFELEPTTMYVRREAFMLEFYAYQNTGGSLGHTSGLARVDFT